MCSHTYVHFTLCDDIAVHTHQCSKCQDALYIMFCPDYKVITQTQEGGCPKHRWRKSKDDTGKDGENNGEGGSGSAATDAEKASG
jgi:hypothetical protein